RAESSGLRPTASGASVPATEGDVWLSMLPEYRPLRPQVTGARVLSRKPSNLSAASFRQEDSPNRIHRTAIPERLQYRTAKSAATLRVATYASIAAGGYPLVQVSAPAHRPDSQAAIYHTQHRNCGRPTRRALCADRPGKPGSRVPKAR